MRATAGALVVTLGSGCSVVCEGPGCAWQYPQGRLAVCDGSAPADLDAWDDAELSYDGGASLPEEDQGSGWSVGAVPVGTTYGGRILVGQPDANQVIALDAVDLRRVATWAGVTPKAEFGQSLFVQPAPDASGAFDLWVGAPGTDYGRGAVRLFRGAELDRVRSVPDLTITGVTPNDRLGERIVPCADLTGDRIPEVVVVAPFFSTPAEGWPYEPVPDLAGAVFLLLSENLGARPEPVTPWSLGPAWWGTEVGQGAGAAVSCDRDLDLDGAIDLVIGSPYASGGRGSVSVLAEPLPESGPLTDPVTRVTVLGSVGALELFGASFAALDVGTDTLFAIGAPGFANGSGRVHLVRGADLTGDASPEDVADVRSTSDRIDIPDHIGKWLDSADLDGDLLEDLIVGAPDYKEDAQNAFDAGRVWGWYASDWTTWGIGLSTDEAQVIVRGDAPFERVGRAVLAVDLDADDRAELIVPTRAAAPRDGG
ncbi:MAG: hypothetical protein ABMA64_06370 [Myxococcota bacterium]